MAKTDALVVTGTVTESLADSKFRVQLETGSQVLAYLAGRLSKFHIRVVPGDTVEVELSPYDLTRGRIVYRKK